MCWDEVGKQRNADNFLYNACPPLTERDAKLDVTKDDEIGTRIEIQFPKESPNVFAICITLMPETMSIKPSIRRANQK